MSQPDARDPGATAFVHLHTHSALSLAEGAIRIKELVKLCVKSGMPAVAVTDTNNLFGAMEFALEAAKAGVQPILGTQLCLGEDGVLVLLVQSEAGYRTLCRIVSQAYEHMDSSVGPRLTWDALERGCEGLLCLTGGPQGPLSRALARGQAEKAAADLDRLQALFPGRLYVELQRHGLPEEDAVEDALVDLAYSCDLPLLATNEPYFARRDMHEAHDALLCIAQGRYVAEPDRRRVSVEHYFKSAAEMRDLFADLPEAVDNTLIVARRCHFLLRPVAPLLPPFHAEPGFDESEELRAQAREGLEWRLEHFVFTPEQSDSEKENLRRIYTERLGFELGVIIQMGFPGYFLIVSDFIKWAKSQNIPVGPGRGSGAGSVVAWSLKITDLDPIRLNLLFERFLNPERVSMPDFDIDFCQDRRDEVIRYVQGRYGHDRVAQIITFGTLQARAVVRDVGRVLQMPYGQVDRIAKMIPSNPANPVTLEEALAADPDLRAETQKEDTSKKLIEIAVQLEGLYRHASTHAAGLVIGDRALHDMLPLYRDPRSDLPVTQFNMKYVEQTGLVKFDFLGLKTMTVIRKAVDLICARGEEIDYLKIPLDDPKSYALMSEGRTTGVFQLESGGMRDTLRRMRPNRFEDIIALVALYRPGPMDNIPRYIDVKEGREQPDYMHPKLEPYLKETYGIMIYQEQVMQAAQVLAGYTLGGADLLRRAMGKKIKAEMDAQRARFVEGAQTHSGVPAARAEEIFDTIEKFAGYGFNKSHAAAYALIAYWTAWLKANYPLEFMAASMTLDMGNTDKLAVFKQDLDRMGIALACPDINLSLPEFGVEYDNHLASGGRLRYALAALKGVGGQAMADLVRERTANGPFSCLENFADRLDSRTLNKKSLEQLVCAGAFDSLQPDRARLLEGAEILLGHAHARARERESGQASLFGGGPDRSGGVRMADLPAVESWDSLERLRREFDAVGFYLSAHPLDSQGDVLHRMGVSFYADVQEALLEKSGGRFQMAGVVIKKQQKVSAKTGNRFAILQISDPTGVYEAMVWSEAYARARDILEAGARILMTVDAESREDQIRFTVQTIERLDQTVEERLREVRIDVDSESGVEKLRTLLGAEGAGLLQIRVLARVGPMGTAEMILPGRWALGAEARNALRAASGIGDVREA